MLRLVVGMFAVGSLLLSASRVGAHPVPLPPGEERVPHDVRWDLFALTEDQVRNNAAPGAPADGSTDSPAAGTATFFYDHHADLLIYTVTWQDLQGLLTAMHVHGPAGPNESAGGHLFDIFLDERSVIESGVDRLNGAFSGSIPVANFGMHHGGEDHPSVDEQFPALFDGRAYVNVHTDAFPRGEIRGNFPAGRAINAIPLPAAAWPALGLMGVVRARRAARRVRT